MGRRLSPGGGYLCFEMVLWVLGMAERHGLGLSFSRV